MLSFVLFFVLRLRARLRSLRRPAKTWLMDGKSRQLLTLYEQRIQRSLRHNLADLRAMQAHRLAALQQTVEEELLLAQLAQSKGEIHQIPEEVATPEFVFSREEIDQTQTAA